MSSRPSATAAACCTSSTRRVVSTGIGGAHCKCWSACRHATPRNACVSHCWDAALSKFPVAAWSSGTKSQLFAAAGAVLGGPLESHGVYCNTSCSLLCSSAYSLTVWSLPSLGMNYLHILATLFDAVFRPLYGETHTSLNQANARVWFLFLLFSSRFSGRPGPAPRPMLCCATSTSA